MKEIHLFQKDMEIFGDFFRLEKDLRKWVFWWKLLIPSSITLDEIFLSYTLSTKQRFITYHLLFSKNHPLKSDLEESYMNILLKNSEERYGRRIWILCSNFRTLVDSKNLRFGIFFFPSNFLLKTNKSRCFESNDEETKIRSQSQF